MFGLSAAEEAGLRTAPRRWLITGVAGFIGSNLLEALLALDQKVVGLDDFSTGNVANLEDVRHLVGEKAWSGFTMIEGDIRDAATCERACAGVEIVLHQAAVGSVPRSVSDPATTHASNATGHLNVLLGAVASGVKRVVYASSSAVYGDEPSLPKVEERVGRPLSPYAVTKCANELYGEVFSQQFGLATVGLRYFNVFGPRQDPEGAYAAVIPRWISALLAGHPCHIFGDGETSRDFCYIDNAVQANIRAALAEDTSARGGVYNVAIGNRTTLNELFATIRTKLAEQFPEVSHLAAALPEYGPFRSGDIRHSLADTSKARTLLGYAPTVAYDQGLDLTVRWFGARFASSSA